MGSAAARKVNSLAESLALIFDMDGVIVDSNPVHEEAWRLYMRGFGVDLDEKQLGGMYGRRNDEIAHDFFGGGLDPEQLSRHGAAKEEVYRRMMADQLEQRLVPGIRSFLERHRGERIGLATNAEPENVAFVLERARLRDYFQVAVDGHQVDQPKPHPQIYLLAARLLRTAPQNCIVFEDSFSGIEAAKAAGTRVVGVTTTHASLSHVNLNVDDFLSSELEPWLQAQQPLP